MEVKLLKIFKGVSDLSGDYMNDFDIIDEFIFYNIKNGIYRVDTSKEYENKTIDPGSDGEFYSSLSIDKKRRIMITGNSRGIICNFSIDDKGDTKLISKIELVSTEVGNHNSVAVIRLNPKRKFIITGIGYSENENDGQVFMIQDYLNESPDVFKIFKQTESLRCLQFLRSVENCIIIGGGNYYGKEFVFTIFDYSERKVIVTSNSFHKRPIRSIVSFFTSDREERIVTSSSDEKLGIWKLDGTIVHNHDLKEMNSDMLLVNNNALIISGNWGSISKMDLTTYDVEIQIEKDSRGSTTHVGRCEWMGMSKIFVATHGDDSLRIYKVKNVKRMKDQMFFDETEKEDEIERISYLSDFENMEKCLISVKFLKMIESSICLPNIFFI